jgi:sugar lactone lactonase YvrE
MRATRAICLALVFAAHPATLTAGTPGTISTVAGNGTFGYAGDAGPATSAELGAIYGVAVDGAGNLYLADGGQLAGTRVRKITASTGIIATIAGNGTSGYSGDGGPATSAEINCMGIAVDAAGNLYLADFNNQRVRKVSALTGVITTLAGNGTGAYSGDGAAATSASLHGPRAVALDAAGNIYIADQFNNAIRMVTAATGIISTIAGTGSFGYSGDGGPASSARLDGPQGVAIDSAGNVYLSDSGNFVAREVIAATGTIHTIAGTGTSGYGGDGGPATQAQLGHLWGIAVDGSNNVYLADWSNQRIRMVSAATGNMSTVAGNGIAGYTGDGAAAVSAELNLPETVASDRDGNLYIADADNYRIRAVSSTSSLGGSINSPTLPQWAALGMGGLLMIIAIATMRKSPGVAET